MAVAGYASASLVVRNLEQVTARYEVLDTQGKFRIVRFDPPYFGGAEFWIVNEKGFLWEPADDLDGAFAYLETDEAREYNESSS